MPRTLEHTAEIEVVKSPPLPTPMPNYLLWQGDVEAFLELLPKRQLFDLVVTSPPYNLGKPHEEKVELDQYVAWQRRIIQKNLSACQRLREHMLASGEFRREWEHRTSRF